MTIFGQKVRVFACRQATDMRSSYDSLAYRTKAILKKDPYSGHMFLFVNKKRSSCKCLYYDGTGFIILSKRLDRGRFSKFNPFYRRELLFTQSEFSLFLEGANLNKRFIDSPPQKRVKSRYH